MSIPLVDETLIEAVRGQKILYEKSYPKYHDNGAKSKAWKKIADDCFEGSILIFFVISVFLCQYRRCKSKKTLGDYAKDISNESSETSSKAAYGKLFRGLWCYMGLVREFDMVGSLH